MTDARRFNTIYSLLHSVTLAEELIAVGGVVCFLWGLTFSSAIARIVLFAISGAIILYVIVKVWNRSRHSAVKEGERTDNEHYDDKMKKLVFDDFQSSGRQYRIDFSEEPERIKQEPMITEKKSPENTTKTVYDLSEFMDATVKSENNKERPRAEFNTLIHQVLRVVKDMQFAYTVALFWFNREKQQLVLECHISDSKNFMTHKRLPIGSDIISQIAVSGKPQIVNYISSQGQEDILPYYQQAEAVKTFAGIPIFFSDTQNLVAVLVLDCLEADSYGNETIASLAQVAKLISTLLQSYTSKYDLLLDSEVMRSIDQVHEQLTIDFGVHSITRSLADETSRLIPWDYITIVLFDDSRKSWVVNHLLNRLNDSYVSLMSELDTQRSMVCSVIQAGVPKIIDDVTAMELPRFYQAERCDSQGSLIIVPLNSLNRCYGALVVESKDVKTYSEADVKLVQKLTNTSSWALEILSLTEVMNNYVSLDETTGVFTRKNFMGRLLEEVQRANDFSYDLSLVMISIDRMDEQISRYGRDASDFILQNVGRLVKTSVRAYDVVGRFDFNCFAVLLLNTTSNEASLWAEKIRKNVASNIINIENKSFSVTISLGVAGASQDASDIELLENADRVLHKAIEAGGNIVRVY